MIPAVLCVPDIAKELGEVEEELQLIEVQIEELLDRQQFLSLKREQLREVLKHDNVPVKPKHKAEDTDFNKTSMSFI